MTDSNLETQPPIDLPDYDPAPDKSEETQSPSFLLFGILNGISFACFGLTIFSQGKGNTDLDVFLWTTSGCAVSLCLVELLFCIIGFVAIYRKDYTILLACSTLVATCGIILYFSIGLVYVFCVVMTVFVMEDDPKIVKICLLVTLVLGAARFFILVCSIATGLKTGTSVAIIGRLRPNWSFSESSGRKIFYLVVLVVSGSLWSFWSFNEEAVEALAIANANFGNLLLKVIYSGVHALCFKSNT